MANKSHRRAFLTALEANEDDTTTRLVYADWLDENGDYEEADRQRKWLAAKKWLVELAAVSGRHCVNYCHDKEEWVDITYDILVKAGIDFADSEGDEWFTQNGDETLRDTMFDRGKLEEYWTNWEIVTGRKRPDIPPENDCTGGSPFSCNC